jgi:hypothetical protein
MIKRAKTKMKMKTKITLLLAFCLLMQIPVVGQTKKIAEANFLKTINDIAAKSHDHHSDSFYSVTTITPFSISKTGILTATLNYSQIDSSKTIKIAVPIAAISGISCNDDYLSLRSKAAIIAYKENPETQLFDTSTKESNFHFGFISEEGKRLYQLRKELIKLQEHYKKK